MDFTRENALLLTILLSASGAMAQTDADTAIYKNVKLDSVVVTGRRPMVTRVGTKQIVTVKGSYLSSMGNLGTMLTMTPGIVTVGDNRFEVFGKGEPKYYVDGREVTQQDIFSTIKSGNVARIEIEREPSAKYPSGTSAVVNIVTIKPLKDYISVNLYNTLGIRRKASEAPSFDFTYSHGKWMSKVGYNYSTDGNLNKETYFTEIYHPDYKFRSDEANHSYTHRQMHSVIWSNDFNIDDNHRIGFVYSFSHTDTHKNDTEQTTYNDRSDVETKDIVRKGDNLRNTHNVSLSYSGKTTANGWLTLSADYSAINSKVVSTSDEYSRKTLGRSDIFTRTAGTYDIVTLNADYSFLLPFKINTQVGARYYNTHHPLDYATNNSFVEASAAKNRQTMDDNVSAGYFTLQRNWKKLVLILGGRYEYSDTRMKIRTDNATYRAVRHTSDFLPSATVSWTVSPKLILQTGYSRSVGRQGYTGMNPYPTYADSLAYSTGNSDLRPEYTDNVYLYAFAGSLTVGLSYTNRHDGINTVTWCQDDSRNVVTEMPINMVRSEEYALYVGYQKAFGKLFASANATVTLPNDSYYYRGETHKVNQLRWSGNFNLSYPVAKGTSVYTAFNYQGFAHRNMMTQRRADNWMAGIQSSLLKDRLSLSLSVSDILHHANYNNVTMRYMNTCYGTYGTNDMRGVTLSMTYRLFNKNLRTKASGHSFEAIQRTM